MGLFSKAHKFARGKSIGQRFKRTILGDETYDQLHPLGTQAVLADEGPAPPPPVVPMPDEEDIKRAKRRSAAAQLQRSGRQSTILTDSDRLGP
jgi:hypothetical protein